MFAQLALSERSREIRENANAIGAKEGRIIAAIHHRDPNTEVPAKAPEGGARASIHATHTPDRHNPGNQRTTKKHER